MNPPPHKYISVQFPYTLIGTEREAEKMLSARLFAKRIKFEFQMKTFFAAVSVFCYFPLRLFPTLSFSCACFLPWDFPSLVFRLNKQHNLYKILPSTFFWHFVLLLPWLWLELYLFIFLRIWRWILDKSASFFHKLLRIVDFLKASIVLYFKNSF